MPSYSLRRYGTQARAGAVLSLLATGALLALLFILLTGSIAWSEYTIYYGQPRRIAIYVSAGLAVALGIAAFGLAINSIGHRQNDKPLLSWVGFFLGAAVLVLTLILLSLVWLRGEFIPR